MNLAKPLFSIKLRSLNRALRVFGFAVGVRASDRPEHLTHLYVYWIGWRA